MTISARRRLVFLCESGTDVRLVTGLKQPLPAGSRLPLDLNFQKSAERHVEAEVKPAGAAGAGM